jgi:hypothetical protein
VCLSSGEVNLLRMGVSLRIAGANPDSRARIAPKHAARRIAAHGRKQSAAKCSPERRLAYR